MNDIKKEGGIIKPDNINGRNYDYETFKDRRQLLEYLYSIKIRCVDGEKLTIDDIDKRSFVLPNDIETYNKLIDPDLDDRIRNLILELKSDDTIKK